MLPPVGGTAEVFFKLFNALFDKGIRIIAVCFFLDKVINNFLLFFKK